MKDYYDILGVSKTASQDEIKRSFRKLAHQYHPDKGAGNEAKFKEANEAYQVLKDQNKRQQYDQFGGAFQGGGPAGGGFGGFGNFSDAFRQGGQRVEFDFGDLGDLGDVFGQFFGGAQNRNRPRKGQDVQAHIVIDFKDAVFGTEKEITFSDPAKGGKNKKLSIKIPAGIDDGQSIRLTGQGGPGTSNGPFGDLYVVVGVKADPKFPRHGFDIVTKNEISYSQAVLGDKIEVETIDGLVTLKIPEGTESGRMFRIRGKGITHLGGHGRGDHLVQVDIKIPTKLSRKQKKLIKELEEEDL